MRMPSVFIGHGSPINAISDNSYTKNWREIGGNFIPTAIIVFSAHWYTLGSKTQDEKYPQKINDMYGFPEELYNLKYQVSGLSELTKEIVDTLGSSVSIDNSWGIDHGSWSVLVHMYPQANIPVIQISIDKNKNALEHFNIGEKLSHLRDKGYMIISSGNIVHNLGLINSSLASPYPWAVEFDDYIESAIKLRDFDKCINYLDKGKSAQLSVPTPDHYFPLLTLLGTIGKDDEITVFNKAFEMGSISMTSYIFE